MTGLWGAVKYYGSLGAPRPTKSESLGPGPGPGHFFKTPPVDAELQSGLRTLDLPLPKREVLLSSIAQWPEVLSLWIWKQWVMNA